MMLHASQFHCKVSMKQNLRNQFLATYPPIKIVMQKINPFHNTEKIQIVESVVSLFNCTRIEKDEGNVSSNEETEKDIAFGMERSPSEDGYYSNGGNKQQRSPEDFTSSDEGFVDGQRVPATQAESTEIVHPKLQINLWPPFEILESPLDKGQGEKVLRDATLSTTTRRHVLIKHVQEISSLGTKVLPSLDNHIACALEEPANNFKSPKRWNSPSAQNKVESVPVCTARTSTSSSHLTTEPKSTFETVPSCGRKELKSKKRVSNEQNSKGSKKCNESKNGYSRQGLLLSSQCKYEDIPQEFKERPEMLKYWYSRYDLFTKYDEGIKLDMESWYSVTQESIAIEIAQHCKAGSIFIDAFCGCGGNAIQFARRGGRVIAIDIDPLKVEYAKHNARIYGVAHLINFVVADFMEIGSVLKGDVVFLSPPWGGPGYIKCDVFNLETMIPLNGIKVFETARLISPNIIYFLPRNVDINQLKELAGPGNLVQIRKNYIGNRLKVITAYYGNLVDTSSKDVAKGH